MPRAKREVKVSRAWKKYVAEHAPRIRGHMFVLSEEFSDEHKCRVVKCWCECGKKFVVRKHHLKTTRHCGCRTVVYEPPKKPDFTGETKGLILFAEKFDKDGRTYYRVECACRKAFEIYWRDAPYTTSCGSQICKALNSRNTPRAEAQRILDKLSGVEENE